MRSRDLTEFSMKILVERGISLIATDAMVETVIHLLPQRASVLLHCRRREGDCSGRLKETVLHLFKLRHHARIECGN